jgi:threonine synthase
LTLVDRHDYDHCLSTTAPTRSIPLAAVRDAAATVYAAAIRTPLIAIDLAGTGSRLDTLYLKLESLQPIGSFKIRGAYNAVRQIPPAALSQGVWTVSAGNAAQGVAFAARKLGVACSVMVMDNRAAGGDDCPRQLRRVLADGRRAPIGADGRTLRPPVR